MEIFLPALALPVSAKAGAGEATLPSALRGEEAFS